MFSVLVLITLHIIRAYDGRSAVLAIAWSAVSAKRLCQPFAISAELSLCLYVSNGSFHAKWKHSLNHRRQQTKWLYYIPS